VFDEQVDDVLRRSLLEIEKRYEIKFIEIGVDKDHMLFSAVGATYSVTKLVKMIKRLDGERSVSALPAGETQKLWGGEFWSDGYCASTVEKHRDEGMIAK
jgi:REP element-mobilizing transposase RayT